MKRTIKSLVASAMAAVMTFSSVTAYASDGNNINPYLLGVYRDTANSNAYINAQSDEVYLIIFSYTPGVYYNAYASSYALTAANFGAYCSNPRRVDEDGDFISLYSGTLFMQGNVDWHSGVKHEITSKSGRRTYVQE